MQDSDEHLPVPCEQAENEKDPHKLLELVLEINVLIEAKRDRKAEAKDAS